jgi:hypothetical protein
LSAALLLLCSLNALASPTVRGPIRSYATIYSIGVEWDITGDTNHNATCTVQYRRQGDATWKTFLPLMRVDFRGWYGADSADRQYNMLAGSVMFLDSNTSYQLQLGLRDPDGGGVDTTITVATRPVPALPTGGRTLHVAPGTGSGDGSAGNPYKGLAAAENAAQAGDIILVHAGNYGNFSFSKPGSIAGYLVWKAAGDGDAVLDYGRITSHHVWLYGLTFTNSTAATYALVGQSGSPDNVVTRCRFTGFNYNITMQSGSDNWYIADNVIVGDKTDPRVLGDFGGEGVELEHTSGHTVCYNSISRTADGVSYAERNCDIFGNDIFDVVDDGIEPDYGYANIRMWGNRITNPRNHAFSLQPMFCGPWYIIRNQVMGAGCYMLKYRVVDRLVLAHNTFVGWNTLDVYDQNVLSALSRNNLWIQAGGSGYIWEALSCTDAASCTQPERWAPDWRTDVDRDGFDWSYTPVFKWGASVGRYNDLVSFVAASGIETHAIRVDKAQLFDSLYAPGSDSLYDRHYLTLKPGCAAVDTGSLLPGINDDYQGRAPDLGVYELGAALPHYGPRPEGGSPVMRQAAAAPAPSAGVAVRRLGQRGLEVSLRVAAAGRVVVALYDLSGNRVALLLDGWVAAGNRVAVWNRPIPAGAYSLTMTQASGMSVSRLVLR